MNRKISHTYKYIKEYGIKCFIISHLAACFPYNKNGVQWKWELLQKKHAIIIDYLGEKYYKAICKYNKNEEDRYKKTHKGYIWTAWLQGEENAPECVKLTLSSIRNNANGHPIIVLTNQNIKDYIKLPPNIIHKHETGEMSHAHYTDVIRMMILAEYGGIWLDATTLLCKAIDEKAFSSQFYSIGFDADKSRFVSGNKWNVRIIGGESHGYYLSSISRMLTLYWQEHSIPIDYFVFDYLIATIYKYDSHFQSIIEELPKLQRFTHIDSKVLSGHYDESVMNEILCNSPIYTLSYKCRYDKKMEDGRNTNYYYLCKRYLDENMKEDDM